MPTSLINSLNGTSETTTLPTCPGMYPNDTPPANHRFKTGPTISKRISDGNVYMYIYILYNGALHKCGYPNNSIAGWFILENPI